LGHEPPYPGPSGRAERIRATFDLLWPVVLAVFGLVVFAVLLIRPELRSVEVFAVVGAMLSGGSIIGLATRGRGS
jgi:hypothetical protein